MSWTIARLNELMDKERDRSSRRDCKLQEKYCREPGTELSEKDVFEKAKSPDDDIEVMMVRAMFNRAP
jgi:hypothetical protein